MTNCPECDTEIFEVDVMKEEWSENLGGYIAKIFRCPKCFKMGELE